MGFCSCVADRPIKCLYLFYSKKILNSYYVYCTVRAEKLEEPLFLRIKNSQIFLLLRILQYHEIEKTNS